MSAHSTLAWRFALILMVIASLFTVGLAFGPQVDAEPIRADLPQKERVKNHGEWCKDLGGTAEVTETKTMNSAGQPHAFTSACVGGAADGIQCVFTQNYSDCRQVLSVPTQAPFGDLSDIGDAHSADLPEATPLVPNWEDSILPEETDPGTFEPSPIPSPIITDQANPGLPEDAIPGLPDPTPTPASARTTAAATEAPFTPTAVTGDPPAALTVPTNDNTESPGEAEDPTQVEPTPAVSVAQ